MRRRLLFVPRDGRAKGRGLQIGGSDVGPAMRGSQRSRLILEADQRRLVVMMRIERVMRRGLIVVVAFGGWMPSTVVVLTAFILPIGVAGRALETLIGFLVLVDAVDLVALAGPMIGRVLLARKGEMCLLFIRRHARRACNRFIATPLRTLGLMMAAALASSAAALVALGLVLAMAFGFLFEKGATVGDRNLVIVGMDFRKREKAVAIAAVIDERGLQRRFDPGDFGEVNIAAKRLFTDRFEVEFLDAVAFEHDHPSLFRVGRVDYHLVGHEGLSK